MKGLICGLILGVVVATVGGGFAGDYLHPTETQAILGDIRTREALETIQMQRQNYLDGQVRDAGKQLPPCR